jgi:hypothetical protein
MIGNFVAICIGSEIKHAEVWTSLSSYPLRSRSESFWFPRTYTRFKTNTSIQVNKLQWLLKPSYYMDIHKTL